MSFLEKILLDKKLEVEELLRTNALESFQRSKLFNKKIVSVSEKIKSSKNLSVIAEIKKASPSKGVLRTEFNHLEIADIYSSSEVAAISILTDQIYFNGDIKYLNDIALRSDKPLLRKDFIIDEIQIFEARANGADLILLITEALSKEQILTLTKCAQGLGLEVLLELHSESQLEKIDFSINELIGVNNRNLETFVTDIESTVRLKKLLPSNVLLVSESGISSEDDVKRIKDAGCDAVLAGEIFMRSSDIAHRLGEFLKWCENAD